MIQLIERGFRDTMLLPSTYIHIAKWQQQQFARNIDFPIFHYFPSTLHFLTLILWLPTTSESIAKINDAHGTRTTEIFGFCTIPQFANSDFALNDVFNFTVDGYIKRLWQLISCGKWCSCRFVFIAILSPQWPWISSYTHGIYTKNPLTSRSCERTILSLRMRA